VFNEYGVLRSVLLCSPDVAFVSSERVKRLWQGLGYTGMPSIHKAKAEHRRFSEILQRHDVETLWLESGDSLSLDAIYVRDAAVVVPGGVVLCNMGKQARETEPAAAQARFEAKGINVVGRIEGDGRLEGGDLIWLDDKTLMVGRGYRTNAEGIGQLKQILGPEIAIVEVPLPHWRGPEDVFHLMSMLSPIDHDLIAVYSPLLPVPLREWLLDRGMELIEVGGREFNTLGCNILTLAPRTCVVVTGNPRTKASLRRHGVTVLEYLGDEISLKGAGGPTCLTRPLTRVRVITQ
jgi:N-dimethylarginine dimethylaminohydrolase